MTTFIDKLNKKQALCVFLFLILGILTPVNVSSELFITPKNSNQEKALFYKLKPGEVRYDSFDLTNISEENTSFTIEANDISVTNDGSITILQNKENNSGLASWLDVLQGAIVVKPNTKVNIPLKIQVPENVKGGEYAAAISLTTLKKDQTNAPVKTSVRKGLKIYVFVESDTPLLSSKINEVSLLNPESESRVDLEKKLSFWDKNNIVFSFKAQDLGNTFSAIKGKYTIIQADGRENSGEFSTNLAPYTNENEYFISTFIPYQTGKTTIKLNYQVEALNKDFLDNIRYENISGSLYDEIDLNSSTLARFRGIDKAVSTQNTNNYTFVYILRGVLTFFAVLVIIKLIRKRYIKL